MIQTSLVGEDVRLHTSSLIIHITHKYFPFFFQGKKKLDERTVENSSLFDLATVSQQRKNKEVRERLKKILESLMDRETMTGTDHKLQNLIS